MTSIAKFLNDNLQNKMAYVSSDGLLLEGAIEQKCKLEFNQYYGIICSVELEYNSKNIIKEIEQILIQNRENFQISYDTRDAIINSMIPILKEKVVQVGRIIHSGISNFSTVYDKDILKSIEIKYLNGSTTRITCIEDCKN